MIQLNESTTGNIVVLTLNEDTTIQAPINYLFEFISTDTNVSKTFLPGTDPTNKRCYYNEYRIYLVAIVDEDLLDGKVNLKRGRYKYNIYQQNSTTNLDTNLSGSIIEKGFVSVNIPIIEKDYDGNEKEFKVNYGN